jgi:hypothetical protein
VLLLKAFCQMLMIFMVVVSKIMERSRVVALSKVLSELIAKFILFCELELMEMITSSKCWVLVVLICDKYQVFIYLFYDGISWFHW